MPTTTSANVRVTMLPASPRRRVYGIVEESAETIDITGRAAHSRSHPHRILRWEDGRVTTSAEPIVIANTPVERSPHAGTVAEGDVVICVSPSAVTEHTVAARPLDNPVLVPISGLAAARYWAAHNIGAAATDNDGPRCYCGGRDSRKCTVKHLLAD